MTALPLHAVPVIVNDQVRLRVYRGGKLELEVPLRQRQALVLATRLLNLAMLPECGTGSDQRVLEAPGEDDVAVTEGCAHG